MNNQTLIENYLNDNGFENLKDYEGKYMINREGKIWSVKSKKEISSRIDKGHLRIGLMTNGKQKQYRVNELLEIQFGNKINEYIHHTDLTDFEDLKEFEGLYKINRNGDIWSCVYNKMMKPFVCEDGYLKIGLKNDNSRFKRSIHRLLAIQYIPNPDNLPEIDHIDRNKSNNNLENLRWATHHTNVRNRDFCINRKGCIYQDVRKDGKVYWKASISVEGKVKQKSSVDREVVEEWLNDLRNEYTLNEVII
jgi:hypothetical protein